MTDQQAGSPNAREVQYWNSAHTRAWADEHETIDRLFAGLTQIALDHASPKLGEELSISAAAAARPYLNWRLASGQPVM